MRRGSRISGSIEPLYSDVPLLDIVLDILDKRAYYYNIVVSWQYDNAVIRPRLRHLQRPVNLLKVASRPSSGLQSSHYCRTYFPNR